MQVWKRFALGLVLGGLAACSDGDSRSVTGIGNQRFVDLAPGVVALRTGQFGEVELPLQRGPFSAGARYTARWVDPVNPDAPLTKGNVASVDSRRLVFITPEVPRSEHWLLVDLPGFVGRVRSDVTPTELQEPVDKVLGDLDARMTGGLGDLDQLVAGASGRLPDAKSDAATFRAATESFRQHLANASPEDRERVAKLFAANPGLFLRGIGDVPTEPSQPALTIGAHLDRSVEVGPLGLSLVTVAGLLSQSPAPIDQVLAPALGADAGRRILTGYALTDRALGVPLTPVGPLTVAIPGRTDLRLGSGIPTAIEVSNRAATLSRRDASTSAATKPRGFAAQVSALSAYSDLIGAVQPSLLSSRSPTLPASATIDSHPVAVDRIDVGAPTGGNAQTNYEVLNGQGLLTVTNPNAQPQLVTVPVRYALPDVGDTSSDVVFDVRTPNGSFELFIASVLAKVQCKLDGKTDSRSVNFTGDRPRYEASAQNGVGTSDNEASIVVTREPHAMGFTLANRWSLTQNDATKQPPHFSRTTIDSSDIRIESDTAQQLVARIALRIELPLKQGTAGGWRDAIDSYGFFRFNGQLSAAQLNLGYNPTQRVAEIVREIPITLQAGTNRFSLTAGLELRVKNAPTNASSPRGTWTPKATAFLEIRRP